MGSALNVRVTFRNYGLADFWSGNKVRQKPNFLPKVKSLVNLFKGCGCGQRPQNFMLSQFLDSQTACVWRLNIMAKAF